MRSRLLFVAIGLVLGVGLTSGATWWANGYRTHISTDGTSFTTSIVHAKSGESYTYAVARVCKEGPADVKITGVQVDESVNSIDVVDFAVAPLTAMGHRVNGNIQAYLDEVGKTSPLSEPPTRTLATRCSAEDNDLRDVIVEIRIPDEARLPAAAIKFSIAYTARGNPKSFTTDNGITFCRGDETDARVNNEIDKRNSADQIAHCD